MKHRTRFRVERNNDSTEECNFITNQTWCGQKAKFVVHLGKLTKGKIKERVLFFPAKDAYLCQDHLIAFLNEMAKLDVPYSRGKSAKWLFESL